MYNLPTPKKHHTSCKYYKMRFLFKCKLSQKNIRKVYTPPNGVVLFFHSNPQCPLEDEQKQSI